MLVPKYDTRDFVSTGEKTNHALNCTDSWLV